MPNKKSNRRRKRFGGDGNILRSSSDNESFKTRDTQPNHTQGVFTTKEENFFVDQRRREEETILEKLNLAGDNMTEENKNAAIQNYRKELLEQQEQQDIDNYQKEKELKISNPYQYLNNKFTGHEGAAFHRLETAIIENLAVTFLLTRCEGACLLRIIKKSVVKGLKIINEGVVVELVSGDPFKIYYDRNTQQKLLKSKDLKESVAPGTFMLQLINPANPPAITQGGKTRRHKKKSRKSRKSRKNRKF